MDWNTIQFTRNINLHSNTISSQNGKSVHIQIHCQVLGFTHRLGTHAPVRQEIMQIWQPDALDANS
jgi:hypothetical protein